MEQRESVKELQKKANTHTAIGVLQIIGGALLMLLFGTIELVTRSLTFIEALLKGGAEGAGRGIPVLFIISIAAGLVAIWRGCENYKLASRFRKVSKTVGDSAGISFVNLERRLYWSRKKLLSTLRKQIKKGFWPSAYIDMGNETFIVDYEPVVEEAISTGDLTLDESLDAANGLVKAMEAAGSQIQDEGLAAQVETLVQIARQIYAYVAKNPDKADMVRRMNNYFLPTTAGLLTKYVQLQSQHVKTDNMTEALEKITQVMSTLEDVFKNQLDVLYGQKAMDVEVEIEVLQSMAGM